MLKLCGPGSIRRNCCPVIRPGFVLVCAQADHGLDREGHSWFTLANGLVLGIVRYIRRTVEELVDAVTTVSLHDTELLRLGVFLDDVAEVTNLDPWLDVLDRFIQTLSGCLN